MPQRRAPWLARFLSDFTLGFSDGLTVPFGLTVGLSSLGSTQTVIYAGLAELCAGSISMGIGGYLSALDDVRSSTQRRKVNNTSFEDDDLEERRGMLDTTADDGKGSDAERIRRYLGPLDLPGDAIEDLLSRIKERKDGLSYAASRISLESEDVFEDHQRLYNIQPLITGLSISLGYIIGGLIPLLPYFFSSTIGTGLCWSIGFCLFALFSFGFGKAWFMGDEEIRWRRCLWEGLRMLVLGSLAASAAVLCINLLGIREPQAS
ncbi:hypothetical protein V2G26_017385 [Clonostachys chloroleuca]|uniref:Uncharacterized protein n=1 Tax=Clonostachys chloroleuca TaxID=1926264 RepID=A0AA35MBK6_9HYPO|nr:unnamed protein product [Clonostachys chloroleuca]